MVDEDGDEDGDIMWRRESDGLALREIEVEENVD